MTELEQKWLLCRQILADNLTPSAFQTWFAPIVPLSYEDDTLILQVKSQFIAEYIEENYIQILSSVIFRAFGQSTKLEYRVLIDSTSGASTHQSSAMLAATSTNQRETPELASHPKAIDFDTQLNTQYTFDTFVAGEPNKLARTAGVAISKQPGYTSFNPLFIYGGSGVGKTHLANAIGNEVAKCFKDKRVLYVTANTFKLQYQDAAAHNHIPDFLNFYQQVDVLILDDIQYFAGLKGTQDTFFHIFNYLQQLHKQLILTSDRSPLQLKDIEDRLLTRFKWGLSAEILKPDFALRKAILLNKMRRDGLQLTDEVVDFIANNVRESVRDLEGILASLYAYSTLTDCEIDMALAEQVVSRVVDIRPASIQLADIVGAVCEHFNISEKAIMSQTRTKEVAMARQVSMYLAKQFTDLSLNEIGSYIGHRTHATVLHSLQLVKDQLSIDPVLRHQVNQIQAVLKR